jgi:D-alanine--poly(phosphoribitol) ligase subunit 2
MSTPHIERPSPPLGASIFWKAGRNMDCREKVTQVLHAAIDELNEQLPEDGRLDASDDTVLFGESGELDSLGLVNLIVMVEQRVAETLGAPITLADERAMSERNSPFRTIGTLTDYVCLLWKEAARE